MIHISNNFGIILLSILITAFIADIIKFKKKLGRMNKK